MLVEVPSRRGQTFGDSLRRLQGAAWWSPAERQTGWRRQLRRWVKRSLPPARRVSLLYHVTSGTRTRWACVTIYTYIYIYIYIKRPAHTFSLCNRSMLVLSPCCRWRTSCHRRWSATAGSTSWWTTEEVSSAARPNTCPPKAGRRW